MYFISHMEISQFIFYLDPPELDFHMVAIIKLDIQEQKFFSYCAAIWNDVTSSDRKLFNKSVLNPFSTNVSLALPLKTSENQMYGSGGTEVEHWLKKG